MPLVERSGVRDILEVGVDIYCDSFVCCIDSVGVANCGIL